MDMEKWFLDGIDKAEDTNIGVLNWYRNLFYQNESDTERGTMARAINGLLIELKEKGVDLNEISSKYKAPFDK